MRKYLLILSLSICYQLNGQLSGGSVTGTVSYISSQNIYVKFNSTKGISEGDTLYIPSDGQMQPVLKVTGLSSVSCVCTPLSDMVLPVDHIIVAKIGSINTKPAEKEIEKRQQEISKPEVSSDSVKRVLSKEQKQEINGSITANSYSDFSNKGRNDLQRFRYTLSLDAQHISNTRISFETYISFRHKSGDWAEVEANLFNALKIYNLAVRYDLKNAAVVIGRKINPLMSDIGAVDGIQISKFYKGFTFGAIAGSRPDYADYGFNLNLFEYGGFLAYQSKGASLHSETSIGIIQQMNNAKTDRRYLSFQHSGSLLKNIYLFSSFQFDLFKIKNDLPASTFDLTSAYLSLRYRIKRFSITGSYDSRKNVVYYETYKSFTDRILENETRQGYRLNVNGRINKNIIIGVQPGYRFLKSDPHPSRNIYGYVMYNNIPGINLSATLSATWLESAFINGKIAALNLTRDFFEGKLQTGAGYNLFYYQLPENKLDLKQHTVEADIDWQISYTIALSVNYEFASESYGNTNRIYLQFRKRFR